MPEQRSPIGRRPALEILGLSALAIAQPLFDVLSRESDYFVAHGTLGIGLVAFALLVYLLPALLLTLFTTLLGRLSPSLGSLCHSLIVTLLVAAILLPPFDRVGIPALHSVALSLLVGGATAWGLRRWAILRSFLALLSPLTLAIPLLFLFASPASSLLRTSRVGALEIEIRQPLPIVVLLLDELPIVSLLNSDQEIDGELFPNFARLASTSHWFRNATAAANATNWAVPAILTGRYPGEAQAAVASEYPESLFTMLAGTYDLDVVETQTRLCPEQLCTGDATSTPAAGGMGRLLGDTAVVYLHILLPEELSTRLPTVTATWTDFAATTARPQVDNGILAHIFTVDRSAEFTRFVGRLDQRPEPTLHFLHVMLPHVPWAYLPSGREYWASITSSAFAEGVAADSTWPEQEWLVAQGYQRHLLQVAFVDRLLGELLDKLEQSGLGEEALLIVTADHGLSFLPGQPGRGATPENYADIMAVPLFVRTPGQNRGIIIDRPVELIDVLPTIAQVAGFNLPNPVDGTSLFGDPSTRPQRLMRTASGDFIRTDAESAIQAESLARKLEIFAHGLYSIGAYPSLVGRAVDELALGAPRQVQVRLDQPEHFRRVDPAGRYLPAQVFGRARWQKPPAELDLAVAVNGTVGAVTRSFVDQGGDRFVAVVPEELLTAGENSIDVYVVESSPAGPVLSPTDHSAAPSYRLERSATGDVTALRASDGTTCRLDPEAVDGGYQRIGTGHLGWARDSSGERQRVVIMAFADDVLVHLTTTGGAPPDGALVAEQPGFERAGFRFNLPQALFDSAKEVRIFAVLGERGTELSEVGPDPGRP